MTVEQKSKDRSFGRAGLPPIFSAGPTAVFFVVLSALLALGASRVKTIEDITALLPEGEEGESSLTDLARRWGVMNKVLLMAGPAEPSSDELHRALDALENELGRVEGMSEVVGRVDMSKARLTAGAIMEKAARLDGHGEIAFTREEVEARLSDLKRRLAAPEAMIIQSYLLKDPLGLSRGALSALESSSQSFGAVVERGHLLSADRRHGLIVAKIDFNPMDISRSQRFISSLETAVNKSLASVDAASLKVVTLGGPRYAARQASSISSDVRQAFVLTPVLVVVIFAFFFRRIRLLPAAVLPGGVGILAALCVMGLAGQRLHALTLGFAATITGISVDYAIHLLHRAVHESGGSSKERMGRALRAVIRPVVLGCITTLGAFLLVATSSFTGIRQMALFAAVSVPVAMLATVLGLPAFHGFLIGKEKGAAKPRSKIIESLLISENPAPGRRLATISFFGLLLTAGLVFSSRVGLSGDPKDLASPDERLKTSEKEIRDVFPDFFSQAMMVAKGASLEEALQANDALFEKLLKSGMQKEKVASISPFLPSLKTQERSLAKVEKLFSQDLAGISMKELFKSAGFKEEYFSQVEKGVQTDSVLKETYKGTSLEPLVADMIKKDGNLYFVLTRVRSDGNEDTAKLIKIAQSVPGCTLASQRLQARRALRALQNELVRMLAVWLGAAIVLLSLTERSIFFGLKAVLPAVFGVAASVGLFGLLGRPLTPVASAGVTLVMGLGIDYGIFTLSRSARPLNLTAHAVAASALTTMAAFGVLAFSKTRAMADLGLIILVGMTAALAAALVLLPSISRKIKSAAALAALFLLAGCGGAGQHTVEPEEITEAPVKMRHQIMFKRGGERGGETHVFEGYMILSGDCFVVKAFAGPGVDLFTVVRNGAKHSEELHMPSLKDRLDVLAVNDDIARVYLGGCGGSNPGQLECDFFGEKMVETRGPDGRLKERSFPKAHGIGMRVSYEEYADFSGRLEPAKISLTWGTSDNLMVIRLLTIEALDSVDPGIFSVP